MARGATCGQAGHVTVHSTNDNDKPVARGARDRALQERMRMQRAPGTARERRTRALVWKTGVTPSPSRALRSPHGQRRRSAGAKTSTTNKEEQRNVATSDPGPDALVARQITRGGDERQHIGDGGRHPATVECTVWQAGPGGDQAGSRGLSTTGERRVRNTPPRMAAAPSPWTRVTVSPSQSQAIAMAAIGVRLL